MEIVAVVGYRRKRQGVCTCGWTGQMRLIPSFARIDALVHTAQCGCEPAIPLAQPDLVSAIDSRALLSPGGSAYVATIPLATELDVRGDMHLLDPAAT